MNAADAATRAGAGARGGGRGDADRPRGRALVTGASKGIGRTMAATLVATGWEVIGTSRRPRDIPENERIQGVRWIALDLTDSASVEAAARDLGEIDVLVNNAGMGQIGPVEEIRLDAARRLFELGLFGPMRLVQAVLPGMRARGRGLIVNVGSVRGELAMPFCSVYAAAKAALRAFSDCLRLEVESYGVRVTTLGPIAVRTDIPQERQYADDSPYGEALRRARSMRDREIGSAPGPEIVARKLMAIIDSPRPRPYYPVGRHASWKHFLIRHMPRGTLESTVRGMHEKG